MSARFLAFAYLSWDFVYLWVTEPRKVRASVPIIPVVSMGRRNTQIEPTLY
jgi:hypothetical protein